MTVLECADSKRPLSLIKICLNKINVMLALLIYLENNTINLTSFVEQF